MKEIDFIEAINSLGIDRYGWGIVKGRINTRRKFRTYDKVVLHGRYVYVYDTFDDFELCGKKPDYTLLMTCDDFVHLFKVD